VREHRTGLQKRKVYLTFDVERDYIKTGYLDPPSFEGIKAHLPRILDKLHAIDAVGTFFLTPEVIEQCDELVSEILKRHIVGLHSHAYYQPEFIGWDTNGDSFSSYETHLVQRMIKRDAAKFQARIGQPKLFRIGRLEPHHTVLKTVSDLGCGCDSSFHTDGYTVLERVRCALSYKFVEVPVTAHLFGLQRRHFDVRNPVILVHPITPPNHPDREVFDLEHFMGLIDECSASYEFAALNNMT